METLEQYIKSVQNLQFRHQNDVSDTVLVSLFLTLNRFHSCSGVFIVYFKQVNVGLVLSLILH